MMKADDTQEARNGNKELATQVPEDVLLILPVRNLVVFPGAVTQIALGRELSIRAAREAVENNHKLGILLQRERGVDEPGPDDLYKTGTIVSVIRLVTAANGMHHLICQGEQRFKALDFIPGLPFLAARYDNIVEPRTNDAETEARGNVLKQMAAEAIDLLPQAPPEILSALHTIESPAALADFVAGIIDISPDEKQTVLETISVRERLDGMVELLAHRLKVLKLSREIGEQTQGTIDQRQREYLLREQLKTIQRELGEEDNAPEIEQIAKAIEDAGMPPEAEKQAQKELKRLRDMPEAAAEHSMVRTYLDWLTELPWSKLDEENIDIAKARETLDEDHYGLDKIKRRILEYLAVRKRNPSGKSPILCFVGPPGVGKTSLGQSIARALGLKFVRASLGGVHDEAEIRGHRRTYIGSLPGTIIQSIRKAGTSNPVFMLDEMDKLGAGGFHGDPSSALLEVLDPAQNSTFRDHYLDVPFDLSKVFFIATANVLDSIPWALRDRMEIIELAGYTHEEKREIARRYLIRRQLEANGLDDEQATIADTALDALIDGYTRESGVRGLEREIGAVLRNVAMQITEGKTEAVRVDAESLQKILGAPKFESELKLRTSLPGVATGLAWTPVGGDILFVEATSVPGNGKLTLTGQLGDVMKESVQAALTLLKGRLDELGIERKYFEEHDLHIHVPAGAIPKDGPSAGITMFVALMSLFSKRTVRSDVAMTGEISLRGLVLPIGGVKEKVLAAVRAGIRTVLLPARNKKDFEDIPESARKQVDFVWLETIDDAIAAALSAPEAREDDNKAA